MTFEEFKQQCATGVVHRYPYSECSPEGLKDLATCYQDVFDSITLDEIELLWYLRNSSFGSVQQFNRIARDLYKTSLHFTCFNNISYYDFCHQAEVYNQSKAIAHRKFQEAEEAEAQEQ